MTQNLLTRSTEKRARKLVRILIKRGIGPYRSFTWSLKIAQTCEKGLGSIEYEQAVEFLLANEWMYRNAKGGFVITEWGAAEALGID